MKRFELEEQIMDCWKIKDDLEIIYHRAGGCTDDELANALLGTIQLIQWKFEKLFNTFEECVHNGEL